MPPRKACDACFKRKIQCSIPTPGRRCDWCNHQGIDCTFLREPQRKRKDPTSPETEHELSRRIAQLEGQLALLNAEIRSANSAGGITPRSNQPGPSPTTTTTTTTATSSSALTSPDWLPQTTGKSSSPAANFPQPCDQLLGLNWYFKGMPILSERGWEWMSSRTGQDLGLNRLLLTKVQQHRAPSHNSPDNAHSPYQERHELPEEYRTREAVDVFYASTTRFGFSALDRDSFLHIATKAYDTDTDLPAKACVWALHAITSRSQPSANVDLSMNSVNCATRAQGLLGLFKAGSSPEILYAVLLLQAYHASTGRWQQSNFLLSIACRIVCNLGGHLFEPTTAGLGQDSFSDPEYQQSHIRRLFWHCYVLDKEVSLRSGSPPHLAEDYCDLTLPADEESLDRLPHDPRLCMVKERICRLLYSPQALKAPDNDLLLRIRQLDSDLEQWRLSIALPMRPRLAIPTDRPLFPTEMSTSQRLQHINLQLDYHYTLTCIHTTVERCGSTGDEESLPEYLHSVLHSSNDLSLEAGRSTLLFLRESMDLLKEAAFSHVSAYVPIAAMSLFTNILTHPRNTRAQSDLEVLVAATGIIQAIPLRTLSDDQTEHIHNLNNFVMELVRLGNCAMWKAKIEGPN